MTPSRSAIDISKLLDKSEFQTLYSTLVGEFAPWAKGDYFLRQVKNFKFSAMIFSEQDV